jgi:hypothetical protein
MNTPTCYLSRTPSGWSLIYQESPLCDYKAAAFSLMPTPNQPKTTTTQTPLF